MTRSGAEVDFVVRTEAGSAAQLIQVCWSFRDERVRKRELGALGEAMRELRTRRAMVVTWLDEAHTDAGIEIVPAWRWLLARV